MNLIEKLGLVVGDQVQYTGHVDKTIYTVKENYDDFVVASGGQFEFLTMFKDEIRVVTQEQLQTELNNCSKKDSSEISITDDCTDIRNHLSPLTGVIER